MTGGVTGGWDRWAPVYQGLERLALGRELERCRAMAAETMAAAALLTAPAGTPAHCVVLGDGDGRGLEQLIRRHPTSVFTSIDVSQGMISRARRRIGQVSNVTWIRADIREGWPEAAFPDDAHAPAPVHAVVTQFFLDCFIADELTGWWGAVAQHLTPGSCWVVSDFTHPTALRGWRALRQRILLRILYQAFRWTTPMKARGLPDLDAPFRSAGWSLETAWNSPSGITGVRLWRAP